MNIFTQNNVSSSYTYRCGQNSNIYFWGTFGGHSKNFMAIKNGKCNIDFSYNWMITQGILQGVCLQDILNLKMWRDFTPKDSFQVTECWWREDDHVSSHGRENPHVWRDGHGNSLCVALCDAMKMEHVPFVSHRIALTRELAKRMRWRVNTPIHF